MKNGGTNTKKYAEAMERRDWQTCDLICEEHECLQKELSQLKADNELMRECIEFYASPYNWHCKDESPCAFRILVSDRSETPKAAQTGGKRAREVLESIKS